MIKKAILFLVPAVVLILLGIGYGNVPGFQFSAVLCFGAAAVAVCYWLLSIRPGKTALWMRRCLTVLLVVGILLAAVTFLLIADEAAGDPETARNYVIVLGAGVNGKNPSMILQERLTAAQAYLETHPEAICIVSGGQGAGEEITEAACMQNYLVNNGIAPERIWMEERATSTWENIAYSLELIEEKAGRRPATVGMISNEFHLLRAGLMAEKQGLEIVGIPAETSWTALRINYYLREIVAIWKFIIFGG